MSRLKSESRIEQRANRSAVPHRRFFCLLAEGWTIAAAGSLAWNLAHNANELKYTTFQTAQALLEKDLLYREWSILHGGVYIPKTNQAGGNSDTEGEGREIVTPSGERLTFLNPAPVSREIFCTPG